MLLCLKMYYKLAIIFATIELAKCAKPGVFFWKPRLSIDLAVPETEAPEIAYNVVPREPGTQVLIDGYTAGLTIIALAAGLTGADSYPYLDPRGPYFYTDLYKWAMRYFSLLPQWVGGHAGHFVRTHQTWRRRYYYVDQGLPGWIKKCLPFISQEQWDAQDLEFKRFKKYAEPYFGRHYRNPNKIYNNFRSFETDETVELNYAEVSSESL